MKPVRKSTKIEEYILNLNLNEFSLLVRSYGYNYAKSILNSKGNIGYKDKLLIYNVINIGTQSNKAELIESTKVNEFSIEKKLEIDLAFEQALKIIKLLDSLQEKDG